MKEKRTQDVTKWDKWYNNQNAATRAWLDARAAEDNRFALVVAIPSIVLGIIIGFIIGISL